MDKLHAQAMRKISVIGLGYTGLPVAVAFGHQQRVVAFDTNTKRIHQLLKGFDINGEIDKEALQIASLHLTTDPADLRQADFHIIAVPSPINRHKHPDFSHLVNASSLVGSQLKLGDIVVYESTVYPGATEEHCIPILEQTSGLKSGRDFFVGYSPERINPGDKVNTFTTIKKIVSAQTPESLEIVANVYSSVVKAGVHRVSSIMVAEAAKVIENTQRDINIALINELAIIFNNLGIDTHEILEAAGTKWNFMPFKPGLVGGHCIGVDPYYLTHKAIECGVHPEVILAGRRINDNMGKYIAQQTIKQISHLGKKTKDARVGILGVTFKENCSDVRNSKVIDIIRELQNYHIHVLVYDPLANPELVKDKYDIELASWDDLQNLDAVILAVSHDHFKTINRLELSNKLTEPKLCIDVKGFMSRPEFAMEGVNVWNL